MEDYPFYYDIVEIWASHIISLSNTNIIPINPMHVKIPPILVGILNPIIDNINPNSTNINVHINTYAPIVPIVSIIDIATPLCRYKDKYVLVRKWIQIYLIL